MSRFMQIYTPTEEGLITKGLSLTQGIIKSGTNIALSDNADKRDKPVKVAIIAEVNYNNKDWDKPIFCWNEEDLKYVLVAYGLCRQYSQIKYNQQKKTVIMSSGFWNSHADDKIIIFKVDRVKCNRQKTIITLQSVVTRLYTTKKVNLKTKKQTLTIRQIIKQSGLKAVTLSGDELK